MSNTVEDRSGQVVGLGCEHRGCALRLQRFYPPLQVRNLLRKLAEGGPQLALRARKPLNERPLLGELTIERLSLRLQVRLESPRGLPGQLGAVDGPIEIRKPRAQERLQLILALSASFELRGQ